MVEKPTKNKYRKQTILTIIVTIIILAKMYLNSPYTHVEERKIINYALQGSLKDFKLNRIYLNKENRTIGFLILDKYKGNGQQIVEIRTRINNYLYKNPKYFLNYDYEIVLDWIANRSGGPGILKFSNVYPTNYLGGSNKYIVKSDALDYLFVSDCSNDFKLDDITDFTLYEDIKGLVLEDYAIVENIEILRNFKSLEFFVPNDRITDEDLKKIIEMFPDCEIYGR